MPIIIWTRKGRRCRIFERALEKWPGDEDTQYFIDACRRGLALPRFQRNFRERTQEAWEAFVQGEAELRGLMDQGRPGRRGRGTHCQMRCNFAPGV